MKQISINLKILIIAVVFFLLVINDHLLKYYYPGFITGKLSDVCGLFVFPLFLVWLFPGRKAEMFFLTTILFLWWKSPLSQPAIDYLNYFLPFSIGRTIDPADLWALLILPFSWKFYQIEITFRIPAKSIILNYFVLSSAFLIFSSTTIIYRPIMINKSYTLNKSKDEIINHWKKISGNNIIVLSDSLEHKTHATHIQIINFKLQQDSLKLSDTTILYPTYSADIVLFHDTLGLKSGQTAVRFNYIDSWPPNGNHYFESKGKYKKWFKRTYIDLLK